MKLPAYVKNCIEALDSAGFSAYAVGGAVRDSLLGTTPSDWDVTTSANPEQTLEVFSNKRTIPTGIKHGTVTVLFEENEKSVPIEITTFRIDGQYLDSRHPESVSFSHDVRDDLSRRDFTVNAMAYNENEGLIDIFGGADDLKNKIIRTVGDPKVRFTEDALRILRAFRFSAQLGFEIESNTLIGAQKCAHLLKNIARERVSAEFKKLLIASDPSYAISKTVELGVWSEVFDGIDAPGTEVISKIGSLPPSFELRLACLISELGEVSRSALLSSLRLSNDENRLVLRLIGVMGFSFDPAQTEISARKFLHLYNNVLDLALVAFDFFNPDNHFEHFKNKVIAEQEKCRPLKVGDLEIRGCDILPLCKNNHPLVGKTLNYLLDRVIENPTLNEREKLLESARFFLEKGE